MASLRTQDLQDVVDISHRALACDHLEELQKEVLVSMERAIGARSSVYAHISLSERKVHVREGQQSGVAAAAVARWCANYHQQDPFMQRYLTCLGTTPRDVIVSSEVICHQDYVATRFYNEFLKPQSIYHVMIIGLKPPGRAPFGVIGLHRSAGERGFSRQEIAKADLMAPCLRGAVERIHAMELLTRIPPAKAQEVATGAADGGNAELNQRMNTFGLSRREKQVVERVQQGLTSLQIANCLSISVRTVNNHLRSIYEKTGVHNRTGLLYQLTC